MNGFTAVIKNSFLEIIDGSFFWVCLLLTLLVASVLLLFQFEEREDLDEMSREAVASVFQSQTYLLPPHRPDVQIRPGLNEISSRLTPEGNGVYRLENVTFVPGRIDPKELLYLISPEDLRETGRSTGFGEISMDLQMVLQSDQTSEEVPINAEELNRFQMQDGTPTIEGDADDLVARIGERVGNTTLRASFTDGIRPGDGPLQLSSLAMTGTFEITRTHPERIPNKDRLLFMFGTLEQDIQSSREEWVLLYLEKTMADWIAGFIGILIGLLVTAGFIPRLQQSGMIEMIDSKATPRWVVFLGRYFGASLFFLFLTLVFTVSGTVFIYLASGVFTGYLLASLPLLGLMFLLVYSVAAFFGLLFRSQTVATIASIVSGLGAWGFLSFLNSRSLDLIMSEAAGLGDDHILMQSYDLLTYLLPSTGEIKQVLTVYLVEMDFFSERVEAELETFIVNPDLSETHILLTTIGFITFWLFLSILLFSRREY